jgi:hypothetical protein
MTLNLTQEEKAERRRQYKKLYSKNYYREQKAENSETYKKILDKAKERYENKKDGQVRQYKKRNLLNNIVIPENVAEIVNIEA